MQRPGRPFAFLGLERLGLGQGRIPREGKPSFPESPDDRRRSPPRRTATRRWTRAPLRTDRAILERYTDQPDRDAARAARLDREALPRAAGAALRAGRPRRSLRLSRDVARARAARGRGGVRSRATARRSARSRAQRSPAVRLEPGLTCNVLTLLGAAGEPALARLRYTHRQRRAFENIRFVLEQELEGPHGRAGRRRRVYAEGVARPMRDAQALVAGQRRAR